MKCDDCGMTLTIGMWPFCPDHGTPYRAKGYEPHWDKHITDHPVWISNPGDKRQYLKGQWRDDYWIKTIERD
jgi:hypothetical protein